MTQARIATRGSETIERGCVPWARLGRAPANTWSGQMTSLLCIFPIFQETAALPILVFLFWPPCPPHPPHTFRAPTLTFQNLVTRPRPQAT